MKTKLSWNIKQHNNELNLAIKKKDNIPQSNLTGKVKNPQVRLLQRTGRNPWAGADAVHHKQNFFLLQGGFVPTQNQLITDFIHIYKIPTE